MSDTSLETSKNLDDVLKIVASEAASNMKANKEAQFYNIGDPEYGLVPEKPIYCNYVDGSNDYLASLRTSCGEALRWVRRGSMSIEGIHGMVDTYDGFLSSGEEYKTIYINMYSISNSSRTPAGFTFAHSSGAAKKGETRKRRYCKYCGGEIDSGSKKCKKCGKQYFHIRTKKISFSSIAAVVIVIVLAVLNVFQYVQYQSDTSDLNNRVSELQSTIDLHDTTQRLNEEQIENLQRLLSKKYDDIEELENEIRLMKKEIYFYDQYVVFVSDDGTKLYHKYGCSEFDDSSFWAYNTEQAESKGYSPCPKC